MNFISKEYLPNSEKRIAHLQQIVDGRPVAILAAGPSIKELEIRISELRTADICYFGLNNFSLQETHILQQIDRNFSVTMCSAREHIANHMKNIINFLDRDNNNIFVSSFWRNTFQLMDSDFDLDQFLTKYNKKLLFFSLGLEKILPNSDFPLHFIVSNSLLVMIQLAIISKASRIILFGADGYCKGNNESYYHNQCGSDDVRKKSVIDDTNKYFNPIAPIALRNIYKTYRLAPIDILNCSQGSACTAFPIVSYNDAFEYLLTHKKFNRKSDLRNPKVTVVLSCFKAEFLKETLENISRQSYVNYELIVICSETEYEIQRNKQQFTQVRWLTEKSMDYIQSIKKVISMAKGKYIFYCKIGNGYLNQDWFNTCVEILENNLNISLVYGLSQNKYEDGALGRIPNNHFFYDPPLQGKNYIYYWLNKKNIFPSENLCVRKAVLDECLPFDNPKVNNDLETWLVFDYRFNSSGYIPYFIPVVANYYRSCNNIQRKEQIATLNTQELITAYYENIGEYKRKLIRRQITHCYRNGDGKSTKDGFNHKISIYFNVKWLLKSKLPKVCVVFIKRILFVSRAYGWKALTIAPTKVLSRMKKSLTQPHYQ